MHERVFGLEYEYTLFQQSPPGHGRLDSNAASQRAISWANRALRSDSGDRRFWPNGGRLYQDVGHVEWATPECRSAREAVVYDKAGERLLERIAREAQLSEGPGAPPAPGPLSAMKNNVDAHGNTFGCHENYLVKRRSDLVRDKAEFFAYLVKHLVPFLVSRCVVCGSGWIKGDRYRLSQRAAFIGSPVSEGTRSARPIVNTRDEPHADSSLYRRLHLISGDANMSEYSTFLKVGTTALVLEMIEDMFLDNCPQLTDPVAALHLVADDLTLKKPLPLLNGGKATALDIQRHYLGAAKHYFVGAMDEETRLLLELWEDVLEKLEREPMALTGVLDWVTKKYLLEFLMKKDGMGWGDPRVREAEFNYHRVHTDSSWFYALEGQGLVKKLIGDEEAVRAQYEPPAFTRARPRAEAIKRGSAVPGWTDVHGSAGRPFELPDPFDWCPVEALRGVGLGDGELVEWLRGGLEAGSASVRAQALRALDKVKSPLALPLAQKALADEDYSVRAAAAEAIMKLKDRGAIRALEGAAGDEHFLVRLRASEALRALR